MKFLLVKSGMFYINVYRGRNAIDVINEDNFGEVEINNMKDLLEFVYNNSCSIGATNDYTALPRCYREEYDFFISLNTYPATDFSPLTLDLSFLDEEVKTWHVRYTNGKDKMFFDIEKLKEEIDKNNIHIQCISRGKK